MSAVDRKLLIINKIFENILNHIDDDKYRKLKKKRVISKLGNDESYIEWLYNAGFYESQSGTRLLLDIDHIDQFMTTHQ